MFTKLFLLFLILPAIELAILIKVGSIIGAFNTIAIIILTALIGAYMVKMEGLNVLYRFQETLSHGLFPGEEILDGLLILVAGAFLLTPGFITDITGFILVIPFSRGVVKAYLKGYIRKKMDTGEIHIHYDGF